MIAKLAVTAETLKLMESLGADKVSSPDAYMFVVIGKETHFLELNPT